jgi:hypothetical protein
MALAPGTRRLKCSGLDEDGRRLRGRCACNGFALSSRVLAHPMEAAMSVSIRGRDSDEDFGPEGVSRLHPAFCSVTASGQCRRPAAARSSASAMPPCGLRYPDKSCSRSAAKRFLQSLRKCRASAIGSRAHALGFAWCDPRRIGKFNKRSQDHVPEQSQPHRIPRQ